MNEINRSTGERPAATSRPRLVILAVFCLSAVVLVIWMKSQIAQRLARLENSFAAIESESFFLGTHAREVLVRLNSKLLRYQLSGDSVLRDEFRKSATDLIRRLSTQRDRLSTESERNLTEQLEVATHKYIESTAELLDRPIRGVRKDSVSQVHERIDEFAAPVLALADQLVSAQRSAMTAFFGGSQDALNSLQRLLWLTLLLLVVLIGAVAALGYRTLVTPLRQQLSRSQSLVERQEKLASLGALAAGVAHEIRNPLTAIKFRLFSFKKALPSSFHDSEDLTTIGNEVNRLERIVKDFLQFARPSEPNSTAFPALELLEQTQRLLRDELKGRGVELTVKESPEVAIYADRQQLQQVLINLIQNGAESIEEGGKITLAVRRGAAKLSDKTGSVAIIDVMDTGKGIPPEAEKRLFDPFFSTKHDGTGLGLAIAARIVEKHGGFIQYTTEPNQGTTFSVILQAALDESQDSTR